MTVAADIANRALDAIGSDQVIGDLEEGTRPATVLLRAYGPSLRQLLRGAHWDFARKFAPLSLLADATKQTPTVGTLVQPPWAYEYQYPIDCVKVRAVVWNQSQTPLSPSFTGSFPIVQGPPPPGTISMPGLNVTTPYNVRLVPARFMVSLDYNYPVTVGSITDWSQDPEIEGGGFGPQQRTVILTNVKDANAVYTALVIYPDEWSSTFQEAFVQLLASRVALPLAKDKKLGLAMRTQAIAMAKDMLTQARVENGNEAGFPQTVDHLADFTRARNIGPGWFSEWGQWGGAGLGGIGFGGLWGGWDAISWADGSMF